MADDPNEGNVRNEVTANTVRGTVIQAGTIDHLTVTSEGEGIRHRFLRSGTVVALVASALVILPGTFLTAPEGHRWGTVVVLFLCAVPLIIAVLFWLRWTPGRARTGTPEQLRQARITLAGMVRAQWRQEIAHRQLDSPRSVAVRWRLTELPVMDTPENVLPTASSPRERLHRLLSRGSQRFEGRSDDVGPLARAFRTLPRRRLVILGEPGRGKTTLAVLLLRELLSSARSADPVPVLLTLSDLRGEEPLDDWLARRIAQDYPGLLNPAFGPHAPRDLVRNRDVLPVLDGLDELAEQERRNVLKKLDTATRDADPLILTCRTEQYADAVGSLGRGVLTGGAVIEPEPLDPRDAAAYVRALDPTGPGWQEVLTALAAGPETPLARALNTPLHLWLLRQVYCDTGEDPSVLLDTGRFPTPGSITDHLLDHLPAALLSSHPPATGNDPVSERRSQPRRAWKASQARHWLGFLAHHLHTTGTRDLAWWRLHNALPAFRFRLAAGVLPWLAAGLAFGLLDGLDRLGGLLAASLTEGTGAPGIADWTLPWLAAMIPIGLASGLVYGLLTKPGVQAASDAHPRPAPPRPLLHSLALGMTIGPATGLATGPLIALRSGFPLDMLVDYVLILGPPFGFAGGCAGGLLYGLLARPRQGVEAVRPAGDSRRRPLVRSLAWGAAVGLAVGLAVGAVETLLGHAYLDAPVAGAAAAVTVALAAQPVRHPGSAERALRSDTGSLVRSFAPGVASGLVFGIAASAVPLLHGDSFAFHFGLPLGLMLGCVLGFASVQTGRPRFVRLRPRGRLGPLFRSIVVGCAVSTAFLFLLGLASALVLGGFHYGLAVGYLFLPTALAVGVCLGVMQWATMPAPGEPPQAPATALRRDLGLAATRSCVYGVGAGLAILSIYGPGPFAAALHGIPAAAVAACTGAGVRYLIAVGHLRSQGRAPWRLMGFLDDMHRLGVLRRVGPVYQFRHAALQERLAALHAGESARASAR